MATTRVAVAKDNHMAGTSDLGTWGRYTDIPVEKMTADQKKAYEFTMKSRGQVPGPYKIWQRQLCHTSRGDLAGRRTPSGAARGAPGAAGGPSIIVFTRAPRGTGERTLTNKRPWISTEGLTPLEDDWSKKLD